MLWGHMLKDRQLEAVRAVILSFSTTTAANLLGITQPAISRLTRDLEQSMRLNLFERAVIHHIEIVSLERLKRGLRGW